MPHQKQRAPPGPHRAALRFRRATALLIRHCNSDASMNKYLSWPPEPAIACSGTAHIIASDAPPVNVISRLVAGQSARMQNFEHQTATIAKVNP